MRDFLNLGGMILLLLLLAWLLGCHKEEPLPPVPPSPEDLSTWSVPELVQPPPPETPPPATAPQEKPTQAEQVLDFAPNTTFALTVPVGAPLDIVLERGEQVRNIIGGDRAPVEANQTTRWEIKEGGDGVGETFRQHIFLTATTPGLTTGLIITTTYRTYYLTCKSVGKSPIRTVRWRYPVDTTAVKPVKEPGLLPDPAQPKYYHVGYELVGTKPNWQPRYVVDDGKKTYIVYPEISLFETVPMVRLIGPNGPQLVNARQYLNVVILDQLLPRAELRVGLGETAELVTITRGAMRTPALETRRVPSGLRQRRSWPSAHRPCSLSQVCQGQGRSQGQGVYASPRRMPHRRHGSPSRHRRRDHPHRRHRYPRRQKERSHDGGGSPDRAHDPRTKLRDRGASGAVL
jgi:type IV secretory pathway VirB9-like protein